MAGTRTLDGNQMGPARRSVPEQMLIDPALDAGGECLGRGRRGACGQCVVWTGKFDDHSRIEFQLFASDFERAKREAVDDKRDVDPKRRECSRQVERAGWTVRFGRDPLRRHDRKARDDADRRGALGEFLGGAAQLSFIERATLFAVASQTSTCRIAMHDVFECSPRDRLASGARGSRIAGIGLLFVECHKDDSAIVGERLVSGSMIAMMVAKPGRKRWFRQRRWAEQQAHSGQQLNPHGATTSRVRVARGVSVLGRWVDNKRLCELQLAIDRENCHNPCLPTGHSEKGLSGGNFQSVAGLARHRRRAVA